jgi:hypothetical protein
LPPAFPDAQYVEQDKTGARRTSAPHGGCQEFDLRQEEGIDMLCEGNPVARPLARVRSDKINFSAGHKVTATSDGQGRAASCKARSQS